jgi:excisionase family DNA binding protein
VHNPRLLSVAQVAEYLGWHENTVRKNLLYSHEIPVIRLSRNGKVWIDRKNLEDWIEKHKGYI